MKKFALILAALAMPMAAHAAPCKDAKGKFIKCPPAAAAPAAPAAKPAAAAPAAKTTAAAPGKKAPCRDAKGRFAKCK